MSEMVERVAFAMAEQDGDIIDGEWCGDCTRRIWIRRATAALTAMREPTEVMRRAAYDRYCVQPEIAWRRMIDEALK